MDKIAIDCTRNPYFCTEELPEISFACYQRMKKMMQELEARMEDRFSRISEGRAKTLRLIRERGLSSELEEEETAQLSLHDPSSWTLPLMNVFNLPKPDCIVTNTAFEDYAYTLESKTKKIEEQHEKITLLKQKFEELNRENNVGVKYLPPSIRRQTVNRND